MGGNPVTFIEIDGHIVRRDIAGGAGGSTSTTAGTSGYDVGAIIAGTKIVLG